MIDYVNADRVAVRGAGQKIHGCNRRQRTRSASLLRRMLRSAWSKRRRQNNNRRNTRRPHPADEGKVELLGQHWTHGDDRALRERIGVQLQETQLAEKVTVVETLRLFRSFYKRGHSVEEVIRHSRARRKARLTSRQTLRRTETAARSCLRARQRSGTPVPR